MKQKTFIGMVCTLATMTAMADEVVVRYDAPDATDRTVSIERDREREWMSYKANELNFEFFGTGTVGERTLKHLSTRRIERNGRLGLGAGLSYFICRYVGVEGYAYSESTADAFIDHAGADLVARLPIGNSGVAPYIFGGAGRQFDPAVQWTYDAGAGVEWRFAPHVGVFVDGRFVWCEETRDYGMGRLGLRVGF
jgi:hypothetical protein